MDKHCNTCNTTKPLSEFSKKGYGYTKSGEPKTQSLCKSCQNEYTKKWYNSNKEEHKKNTAKRRVKHTHEMNIKVYEYLKENPCEVCGESDPVVLDFDHINPEEKSGNIARMRGHSEKTLFTEIAKCRVLCANCHRRRTAKQFDWYSYIKDS
jgi:hypothetical protein